MMRKIFIVLISFIAVSSIALLSSCNKNTVYYQYRHTPISGWDKNDTLFFDIPKLNENGSYNEELGLRINGAYPFMKLVLIVEQTFYPSHMMKTDTLNLSLIDKGGYAKGQGISYYQYKFNISDIDVKRGDSIHVCIRHNMKREILPGISDVGLNLKMK